MRRPCTEGDVIDTDEFERRQGQVIADLFAEVVIIGTALNKGLHYLIPDRLVEAVLPGSRVAVELGKRKAAGIVLNVTSCLPKLPETIKIRPILEVMDELPALPCDLLELCLWLSSYYFYPLGEVFDLVIPSRRDILIQGSPAVALKAPDGTAGGRRSCRGRRKVSEPGNMTPRVCDLPEEPEPRALELTDYQISAFDETAPFLDNPSFQPFVLYGVTGSGKTEVYLHLIEKAVRSGNGSLVLVPEIGISAQMESVFRQRFGDGVAVWHSALTEKERRSAWSDIRTGRKKIVLGARSAVLAPVQDLKLIIVDEEHDTSYKQEDHLRYNARDVALMRGKIAGAPVIMGSATPSVQTLYNCSEKRYRSIRLPTRVRNKTLPEFEIVDMKLEGGRRGIFSYRLREAIGETIRSGRQVLLFLNRRGYDTYYLCNACGHALECESCSVTLTYHKKDNHLRCHYCGWATPLPERCPVCAHAALFSHGFGTEKVEKEVWRLFPDARVVRMDRDTMKNRGRLLSALDVVRSGKADVLLGTQMVAKGHDFPNITLVGIINADAGLQAPDFRAGEVLVQLLIQVGGRAGRGEDPGQVIVQTFNPSHFTIESAIRLDYDGFCSQELKSRESLQYPPFTRLLKILVTSVSEELARTGAGFVAGVCREKAESFRQGGRNVAVIGPSPSAYVKLKKKFRWQVYLKTWTSSDMQSFTESVLESVRGNSALRAVQITVDRDPATEI